MPTVTPEFSTLKRQEIETPSKLALFSSENKILLFIICTISISLLIVASAIYSRYESSLEDDYTRFGELFAKVLAVHGSEKLEHPDAPDLEAKALVESMLSISEDVASVEFYTTQGKLVYESHKPVSPQVLKSALDFSAPVRFNQGFGMGKVVGEVHVKLTGKTMQDINFAMKTIMIWLFVSAWFISILAVSLNTYFLSKHLRTLVRGVRRLSTGDFGYKISDQDLWGELKTLAESFNDMSVRLRAYEDQNLETITFERNKMEAVLLSIADGVIVCDLSGEVSIVNDSACKMLEIQSSQVLLGSNIRNYTTVEGTQCFAPILSEFDQLYRQHHSRIPDVFARSIEMPNLTFKVFISTIYDTEGEPLGFVMIMHDVTKEMEVDRLKTNFISNVSHELRTPVTTIKSYVDTIYHHGEELDRETYQEFIETINVETERLKRLVNDVLDFSRLQEGEYKLQKEFQDMTPVINLTVQSVKVLAQQKNLSLTTAIESNLPKVYMNSDSIERVLRNLLSNAIKYTPDGGRVKVRAEVSEIGDALVVSVQDTGIGIPEEHLARIFDRFYRVENKVHTVKGTGLGLHLVKITIEEHHHGEVFVKSEVGVGSTFGFRIPLNPPEDLEGETV